MFDYKKAFKIINILCEYRISESYYLESVGEWPSNGECCEAERDRKGKRRGKKRGSRFNSKFCFLTRVILKESFTPDIMPQGVSTFYNNNTIYVIFFPNLHNSRKFWNITAELKLLRKPEANQWRWMEKVFF